MITKDNTYIVTAEQGQNLFDLSLQEYGSVSEVFRLLADNPDLTGLNAQLMPGQKLQIQRSPSGLTDESLVAVFRRNKVRINTGDDIADISAYLLQENYDLILQENENGILLY